MIADDKKPLLVNVVGAKGIGVSVAIDRIQRYLNTHEIDTAVANLKCSSDVLRFEDSYVIGKYHSRQVVLFDKHFNVASAARQRLRTPLWHDESIKPDLSVLLHNTTPKRIKGWMNSRQSKSELDAYLLMSPAHWGTDNHHVVSIIGEHGRLFAAGKVLDLILRELSHG